MRFYCIFFDFDGVIIENSRIIALEVFGEILAKYVFNIDTFDLINNYLGMRAEQIVNFLNTRFTIGMPLKIIPFVRKDYRQRLLERAKVSGGLIELLSRLPAKFICSSNEYDYIHILLKVKNIKRYFPDKNIVSTVSYINFLPLN